MDKSWYSLDVSSGWIVVALLVAIGLSILLYSKNIVPWHRSANVLMGFLRFLGISLIIILLLNPVFEFYVNSEEAPKVVLLVDNSESITIRKSDAETRRSIDQLRENIAKRYDLTLFNLNDGITDSIAFNAKTTDLSEALRSISNIYEGQNVGAVIVCSDGIINKGQSPEYLSYEFPVYTVGLGDTIAPKDVAIKSVVSNKVAYQGNQFPINVTIGQKGYEGNELKVTVRENRVLLAQQTINASNSVLKVDFLLNAEEPGLRRLEIAVSNQEGESTFANNRQQFYIDVIEGKDNVLILAPAPHPDIKAIRSVLSQTSNYETTLFIPGIHPSPANKKFDAIIELGAFSGTNYGAFESTGHWYILGSKTRKNQLATLGNILQINQKGNKTDLVKGDYNPNFSKFKLDNDLVSRFDNYPPLSVPFGDYNLSATAETLIYQKIGSVTTERPLLAFFDNGSEKSAILTGSGIWQWKLQEQGSEENSKLFDAIVQKTVQFLSIKTNKDRFIARPRASNYQVGDRVYIDTEVYNDLYERAYGNKITLKITDESNQTTSYELVDSEVNSSFNLGSLPAGIYQFTAQTSLDQKSFTERGSFVIRDIQLEKINLTADHQLLRSLSSNTGGKFFAAEDVNQLIAELEDQDYNNVIHTTMQDFPLINTWWIIFMIIAIFTIEWFLRKFMGAY